MSASGSQKFSKGRARSAVLLGGALAIVLLGIVIVTTRPWRGPSAPVVTANRTNLVLTGGRLFPTGSTNPFTGIMLDHYPNGVLQSRSTVSNGLLEGTSEGYYTNGQVQVRERFRAGKSHGVRVKWFDNGPKLSEAEIADGKLDGLFRRWHENGRIAEQIHLRLGEPVGTSRAYHASGFLKAEAIHESGQVITQRFWKDGEFAAARPDGAKSR